MISEADEFFKQGMDYNLTTSKSFEPALARSYFERSAAFGHPIAMRNLALMLHQGQGGTADVKRAIKLLVHSYFVLKDAESADCLVELLRTEIDAGRTKINGIGLASLADQIESLAKLTDIVQQKLSDLVDSGTFSSRPSGVS